jgi:hypothetical protein
MIHNWRGLLRRERTAELLRICASTWVTFVRRGRAPRNIGGPLGRPPEFATIWAFRTRQGRGERCQELRVHGRALWFTRMIVRPVWILVSRKKWPKAKRILVKLHELVLASEWVDHKVLERIRGFLVYVARTYKPLAPFLMGLHMLIYGWRPGRDDEGWRLRQDEVEESRDSK